MALSEFGSMAALKVYKAAIAEGASVADAFSVAFARLRAIDRDATEPELRNWLANKLAAERLARRRSRLRQVLLA